ncbi:accessory Sec system glycosyltransferase GtfA [Macrococcus capreoli]|uniref:accessory Sec system glycosyltransferase GtfA n=1 Tax=Macrococcus capreoli TaxID=2982690 RepID=UPI003F426551
MIYNINFGIGWASSGVEYAQSYRAELLRKAGYPMKFVFLDFISAENIQTLTSNLGYHDDEIIWLYQYFTDTRIAPTTYTLEQVRQSLDGEVTHVERLGKTVRLHYGKGSFATCYLKHADQDYVDRVELVSKGKLIRKDYYSYTLLYSEYYYPKEERATLVSRVFYNEDGSVAYTEYVNGDDAIFKINGLVLNGKMAFVDYFMQSLQTTREDIVIIDRATHLGQALFRHVKPAKLGVVIHAEHFSENATTAETILWNNHYEYQFKHAHLVDFFITATDIQADILRKQFEQYEQISPAIYTIPVGSLKELTKSKHRKPYAVMTASRLASEKHIDWLIRAVVLAKQHVPELTFDIYGEGGERARLTQLVRELNASDYITFKGHVHLQKVYRDYTLFLTGSTSEGFGLTLMEAVGSGLAMIGLDVNYGNPTFIDQGKNGYLIPYADVKEQNEHLIQAYVQAIIQYFEGDTKAFHKHSYHIASAFKSTVIQQKWIDLIEEVQHD